MAEGKGRVCVTGATKLSPYEPLREILKNFRQKNENALASETDAARFVKDAGKYCKVLSGRVSQGHGGKACLTFVVLALVVGAAVLYLNMESVDFNKLYVLFNSQF
ncbi:hypothetical protein KIW84_021637 [Lathyrus oleraceus]|uniref:Uncharacterized protein n=1 Tax=Pisum sativum TaxID=3888 RepID=A0A9D5B5M3_PEA|nr:hypothetical protein KIW84_021637 [Pisum sativum]